MDARRLTHRFVREGRRYLWTDAFAVMNLLMVGEHEAAVRHIECVHASLAHHRDDATPHAGEWLPGASAEHPTSGGMRIGKPLRDRQSHEPMDEEEEWERDGQYFHYICKWCEALSEAARHSGIGRFRTWAQELLEVATRAFVVAPTRMVWKMSCDLTRVAVPAMGQSDPLDGYVTALQLGCHEIAATYAPMVHGRDWTTSDPLGIGGLLRIADRLDRTVSAEVAETESTRALRACVLHGAYRGLRMYLRSDPLVRPASARLPFRELGLAIGVCAVREARQVEEFRVAADAIVGFWSDRENHSSPTWTDHVDINSVMLATAMLHGIGDRSSDASGGTDNSK
eukprot:TRINITY_DN16918_c0_g1_i1.p1 TRINITY_DN16918_c0_g1~~TRINITY_DN16918_c0_g1_i1.p1  ORF type:complete len:364 (-),score=45.49 TRINITY_DN16918_c0_g1_i1:128-1150(-)